ncbi:MAG: LysR family transcriptional regulator [Flavobacteriales bacterium]|nr:LysR family transcriptional regulator [Flavobacteriales bacterium]MCW8912441.1 LysR family transcriptional regulator [Flavobacteriales bacterium]MCW8936525.1 LysR family transcriptional regulator [Flavobacteriales bacterium]MCW8969594.1 LysR family transcriptional regulator [Flavobacteriales bacterium]MCW8989580.1 LysR family transcriptional regulator [Flavobacteriales bacterium]
MNYTLNQLQIFLKVTDTKSITKASEELHLTQPAVSIQLKNFQLQFDIPLFEVINKRIYITDFGYEIAKTAESILNEVQKINQKSSTYKGLLVGKLKISVVSTGKYVIPYFLSEFIKENPEVELVLDVTNKTKVVESLEENKIDFALISTIPNHLKLNKITLMQNKLFLVGNQPTHTKKGVKQLENISLIYREQGSATRQLMEAFIESNNLKVKKKLVLTSNEAVKQAVIADLGYSIMPLIGIKNELQNKQLQIIPLKGLPLVTSWKLVWLENKKLSPIAMAYKNYIETQTQNIISNKFLWFENF